ncbi:MAG: hypothetical protein IKK21_01190 [Clostridia bacterium]|nr:hypothetical protein [Clostridia bacterium]
MKKLVALVLFVMMAVTMLVPAMAEPMEVEGVEVKYLLDPAKVLDAEGKPTEEVLKLLGWTGKVKNRGMQFLDVEGKLYNEAGWSNRVRIKQGDDEYDITFKKRYAVENGDIAAALALAEADGFVKGLEDYEAELDWGYNKLTLSISYEESVDKVGYDDTVLPSLEDSIAFVQANMPEFVKAVDADITKAVLCGPVYYPRYTGELAGMELDIEICAITNQKTGETEYIFEVAFSTDTYEEAVGKRDEIMKILDDAGVLLKEDGLKTNKILNAYLGE